MDEMVNIVDEQGRPLREALKSEAHAHGWLHTTVIGYVRHGDHWTLVRQAPDRQDAGQLVAPVGGHVKAGETELDALLREAEEEAGIKDITHALLGQARFHRQILGRDENHLFVVYEISTNDDIVLGDEADGLERFTEQELRQALLDTPERFGEALYFVFESFYPHMLPPTWQRRWS
jgi:8-oxo-dGTP pyrophosphatase MutT (NUDIX family)